MKLLLKKMKLKTLFVSLFLFANGCARIEIKDQEFCGDLGEEGASCFHWLSDNERDIDKEQWDEERFGMVCTSSDSFAHIKATILKLCQESSKCDYSEVKEKLEAIEQKLNRAVL